MNIVIASDHGGFAAKEAVKEFLLGRKLSVEDLGPFSLESVDYPDFATLLASRVIEGKAECGILICTTGIGMSIAANRFNGIRAALCNTPEVAALSRQHNDSNVLVLAGGVQAPEILVEIVGKWLDTPFSNVYRHQRRVIKLGRTDRLSEIATIAMDDPEIHAGIVAQIKQEDTTINLIASENTVSRAVREAQGSVLTNKYAEGYPGKRWYNGCEPADIVESIAIERAKKLFGAEHANVQPHCGSAANMAVYFSMLKPGDTILSMSLDQGGHLTHGSPVNFSGHLYEIVSYTVSKETEQLDYGAIEALAIEHKPKMIIAGASAYPRLLDFKKFREIADKVNSLLLVDMAHIAGLVAGGVHPSPAPYADFVTSTTHKTLRGPRSGLILCRSQYAAAIDKTVFPGMQGGPLEHTIASKAICFKEALAPEFSLYAKQIVLNAKTLAETLSKNGLKLVSGGTDNHLMLVNVDASGITGKDAAQALDKAGIICNKNAIPFDTKSPFVTSGIRIGTAAVTSRGFNEKEMVMVGNWIADALKHHNDLDYLRTIKQKVAAFVADFPVP